MNKYLFILIISVLMHGCANLQIEESGNNEYWKPFDKNNIYSLTGEVFLLRVGSGKEPKRFALVPESTGDRGTGFYTSPKSVESYRADPVGTKTISTDNGQFDIEIVGIVEKGTRLKPRTIKRNTGWDLWFGNDTYATRYFEILSGDFSGKIVDVEDLHWLPEKYLIVVTPSQ